MNQLEFREQTGEVAISIDKNQKFVAFRTLNAQRAKKAVSKLKAAGLSAKVSEFDKQTVILYFLG